MLQGVLIRGKEEPEMKEYNNTVEREDDLLGRQKCTLLLQELFTECAAQNLHRQGLLLPLLKLAKHQKQFAKNK